METAGEVVGELETDKVLRSHLDTIDVKLHIRLIEISILTFEFLKQGLCQQNYMSFQPYYVYFTL